MELTAAGESVRATARVRTGVPAGSVFLSPPGLLDEGPVEVAAAREPGDSIGAQPAEPAASAGAAS